MLQGFLFKKGFLVKNWTALRWRAWRRSRLQLWKNETPKTDSEDTCALPQGHLSATQICVVPQGFPDYFALVGLESENALKQVKFCSWVRHKGLTERFQQVCSTLGTRERSQNIKLFARNTVLK